VGGAARGTLGHTPQRSTGIREHGGAYKHWSSHPRPEDIHGSTTNMHVRNTTARERRAPPDGNMMRSARGKATGRSVAGRGASIARARYLPQRGRWCGRVGERKSSQKDATLDEAVGLSGPSPGTLPNERPHNREARPRTGSGATLARQESEWGPALRA